MPYETDAHEAENTIRRYLLYIEDPAQLRDEAEVQRKTQAVLDAHDPIDKLKALADLERAARVDEQPLREGFVKYAKGWADAQSIPPGAFRELGVPDDVLRDAGFDVPAPSERRGRSAAPTGEPRRRAPSVSVTEIQEHVRSLQGTFVLTDIMSTVGGSPATVRKAVEDLVESGQVEKLGPIPNYSGRGRAPIQYSRR